ncbi:MAG: DUF2390 domain-containing protein [Natronospirillum sp.]|uniref:DUF2390 domain-containing protein n=1 Tax=Natronospirillum sp. TaxID=2812955 RepID=UPI0025D6A47A|nr:DUF2390 domain-containing protein [Natronospirillum sp.]MCH8552559.1 DUF2390 domain-containing protein [Natronospirillum sp.]
MIKTVLLTDLTLDFELWRFAGTLYASPGVAARLLDHQDRDGIWINDWLFAAWQAGKGNILRKDFRGLVDTHNDWRTQVILPWRAWRKQVKEQSQGLAGQEAYKRLLRAELALEWHDQAWLTRQYQHLTEPASALPLASRLALSIQRASDWPEDASGAAAAWLSDSLPGASR